MPRPEPATPADADAIAATEAAAAFHPWSLPSVAASLAAPGALAWVVREEGRVVAHLLASTILDEGEVLTVAVRPEARRRGLARALLAACHEAWARQGVTRAFLEVREDNAGARALYAEAGWREVGRRRGYYAEGGDAVVLGWAAGGDADPTA